MLIAGWQCACRLQSAYGSLVLCACAMSCPKGHHRLLLISWQGIQQGLHLGAVLLQQMCHSPTYMSLGFLANFILSACLPKHLAITHRKLLHSKANQRQLPQKQDQDCLGCMKMEPAEINNNIKARERQFCD